MATLTGTAGPDVLTGGVSDDAISGLAGDDTLDGGSGADTLYGGDGNDLLILSATAATSAKGLIDGGLGTDTLDLTHLTSPLLTVTVPAPGLEFQTGGETFDVSNVETFLFGDAGANVSFAGYASPVAVYGGAGRDTLVGGAGNNSLDGGAGDDTAVLSNAYADATVSYGSGTIVVSGPHGVDTLSGIEHVAFSDGSFDVGGDGRLILTPGLILPGTAGDDALTGAAGNDTLTGAAGNDTLTGGPGSDSLDGGDGSDVAAYVHASGAYVVHMDMAAGTVSGGPDDSTDHLTSVETVSFLDGTLNFDPDSAAAQVYRLYDAALGRAPDFYGEASWTDQLEHGLSLQRLAVLFTSSEEFQSVYGSTTNSQFVGKVYETVLHREGDPGGLQTWTNYLDSGTITRAQLIVLFSESDEHRALTADAIGHGIWTPDPIYEDVEFVYQAAFGRPADEGGLMHWATEIEAGRLSFHDFAVTATQSQEFLDATKGLSHGQLVDYLYETALGRAADPGGHAAYTAALDAGHSISELVEVFAQSGELHGLVEPRLANTDWFAT